MMIIIIMMLLFSPQNVLFNNETSDSKIQFKHVDGRSGSRYFLETVGSGVAFFDYDNDGYLDIYLVNSAALPGFQSTQTTTSALYRYNGDGTFTDVTDQAKVGNAGLYGMGCAAGDYDNDGWLDLYVTNFGPNALYKNNGDGSFTEASQIAGVANPSWSLGSLFFDYDNDGNLDLFVANYISYKFEMHKTCELNGVGIYCGPEIYPSAPDALYLNNGDGTFVDVSKKSGLADLDGRGMGVVAGDYDADGFVDLYVANDIGDNFLYHNNGNGTFTDVGWLAGVECDENGKPQGSMGVDFGDYDNDGLLDLVVTNFQNELNSLYHNDGKGFFTDVSFSAGMGYSLPYVGWGVDFFDADNDGDKDLFITNGHIHDQIELLDQTTSYPQLNQILLNDGKGTFIDVSAEAGVALKLWKVSRGAAFGDYDNDGKVDIIISNANDTPDLIHNKTNNQNNWIMLKAIGVKSNRSGIGAKVKIKRGQGIGNREQNKEKELEAENFMQFDEVRSGSSYMSQNDLRLHFGLGKAEIVEQVEVKWPSGVVDVIQNVAVNQILAVIEGSNPK